MANPASLILLLPALVAGAVVPFQAGANATLGRLLGHPLWATLVSLAVSIAVILPLLAAFRVSAPAAGAALKGPWWIWTGGLAGVIYITAALLLAPRLGAANFMVAVIAGQMIASLAIDHFGLMGFAARPVNPARLAGVLLIVGGMVVTQWANTAAVIAAGAR